MARLLRALPPLLAAMIAAMPAADASAELRSSLAAPFPQGLMAGDEGADVLLLQALLKRRAGSEGLTQSGVLDPSTTATLQALQREYNLTTTGDVRDNATIAALLHCCQDDGFSLPSPLPSPRDLGLKFLIAITVPRNRSLDGHGQLFGADAAEGGDPLLEFRCYLHGYDRLEDVGNPPPWPHYSATTGLTQLYADGNTPSGVYAVDVNTPEDIEKTYGKYPVVRLVHGISGNANLMVPNNRHGLLIHSGEWPNWSPGMPFPTSEGCIHVEPATHEALAAAWGRLNVDVNPNTNGMQPYPYPLQGLVMIAEEDER